MNYLQKLGKSIMLSMACLPMCGIFMGIGYLLCPVSMQGGAVSGVVPAFGLFLVKAGGAIIDHLPLILAVSVGVGMSDDQHGMSAITALCSWLIITNLLNVEYLRTVLPFIESRPTALLAFEKIENPFIGILSGLIGAECYNRFKGTDLPEWLGFFSGKRSTVIVAVLFSFLTAGLLFLLWPVLFGILVLLGKRIVHMGPAGAGIFAFLNRLLIPFGLHHALNSVFFFDTIGLGDLTHFWAGQTSKDVSWSLGMYMSGFFPCMMFGVPGAATAMIHSVKKERKKYTAGILASAAFCSFICGITEPFEFAFMFTAPLLYLVYALLYGIFTYITVITGFRAGFSFSAGAMDLILSATLPAAGNTWMILPLGAAAFVVFYLVFRLLINRFDLHTPGREEDEETTGTATSQTHDNELSENPANDLGSAVLVEGVRIDKVIEGLGGAENIAELDNCATRLRITLRNGQRADLKMIKEAGAKGVIRIGKNNLHIIIGLKVQKVADEIKRRYMIK